MIKRKAELLRQCRASLKRFLRRVLNRRIWSECLISVLPFLIGLKTSAATVAAVQGK